jgi:glucosamine--fructose-6-phosphate aminotransferase (isomerizing)
VLALLMLALGRQREMSRETGVRIARELSALPGKIESIVQRNDAVRRIAELYRHHNNFLYLGRGYHLPVALEGALKLKEISYIHAEGYPAGELKHGPIALVEEGVPVVAVATECHVYPKVLSNIQEVKARGATVIAVATEGDEHIAGIADHVLYVPRTPELLAPIVVSVPLQLLAYHIAKLRDCDVDQPRNLAKSVTVE